MFRGIRALFSGARGNEADLGKLIRRSFRNNNEKIAKLEARIDELVSGLDRAERARGTASQLAPEAVSQSSAVREYYMRGIENWLGEGVPWYTRGAREWCEANLTDQDEVLEYGGGKSTVFFARKCKSVLTVEASPYWTTWLMMYFFDKPDLMKRVRLHYVPAEWNPSFKSGRKKYWTENFKSLDLKDVRSLEHDLIFPIHSGKNIVVFDGSLRGPVMVYQLSKIDLSSVDAIIVDNTELPFNFQVLDLLVSDRFERLDFAAGPRDDVPKNQNGKHITTVLVAKDRLARSKPNTVDVPLASGDDWASHLIRPPFAVDELTARINTITDAVREAGDPTFSPRLTRRIPAADG